MADVLPEPRVTVLIPCHNEVSTIFELVHLFGEHLPEADVLVVDDGSTDGTAERALAAGARILTRAHSGKGDAVRAGMKVFDADVLLLIDGDLTYSPADAPSVVSALLRHSADMVIGDRLSSARAVAFAPGHLVANRMISCVVGHLLGVNHADVLSGYRALSADFVSRAVLASTGFEIEAELLCEAVRLGACVAEVPVSYSPRPRGSRSKLSPVRDAIRILMTVARRRGAALPSS